MLESRIPLAALCLLAAAGVARAEVDSMAMGEQVYKDSCAT
jgi:hypothetical protein